MIYLLNDRSQRRKMTLNHLKRFYRNKLISLPILFLLILFCKNLLISEFAFPLPIDDQWDGELIKLYKPYEEGNLSVSHFFASHNEHRIVFTRLFNLAIYILNGNRWNPMLVLRVQSILAASIPSLILFFLYRFKPIPFLSYLFFGVFSCLPLLYENLLSGIQNLFYFMIIFIVIGLGVFAKKMKHEFSRFLILFFLSICTYFSMASGFVFPLIISILYFYYFIFAKRNRYLLVGASFFYFLLGILLYSSIVKVPHIELYYKVSTFSEFISAVYNIFKRPNLNGVAYGILLIWIPMVLLLLRNIWEKKYKSVIDHPFLFGYLILIFIQIFGIAYARGKLPLAIDANRYFDIFLMSIFPLIYLIDDFKKVNSIGSLLRILIIMSLVFVFFQISKLNLATLRYQKNFGRIKTGSENHYQYFSEERKNKGGGKNFLLSRKEIGSVDYLYPNKLEYIAILEDLTVQEILRKSGLDKR